MFLSTKYLTRPRVTEGRGGVSRNGSRFLGSCWHPTEAYKLTVPGKRLLECQPFLDGNRKPEYPRISRYKRDPPRGVDTHTNGTIRYPKQQKGKPVAGGLESHRWRPALTQSFRSPHDSRGRE